MVSGRETLAVSPTSPSQSPIVLRGTPRHDPIRSWVLHQFDVCRSARTQFREHGGSDDAVVVDNPAISFAFYGDQFDHHNFAHEFITSPHREDPLFSILEPLWKARSI